jgi:hypothetical protein
MGELRDLFRQRLEQTAKSIRLGVLQIEWRRQLDRLLTPRDSQLILSRLREIAKK